MVERKISKEEPHKGEGRKKPWMWQAKPAGAERSVLGNKENMFPQKHGAVSEGPPGPPDTPKTVMKDIVL